MRGNDAAGRLIVALDFTGAAPALAMARRLRGLVRTAKVGSALFTACGPAIIARLQRLGFDIMLDLKFFDIPSTVELSCRAAARHGVSLLTVHAEGEPAMLEAAVRGVRVGVQRARRARPLVLGVTVLTSADAAPRSSALRERVLGLAQRAFDAGCDGVVASAQEAAALRRRFGYRLRVVCPGIRPACRAEGPTSVLRGAGRPTSAKRDDQRRVCTPSEALAHGADALIIGRPITAAPNPRAAARDILHEMEDACAC